MFADDVPLYVYVDIPFKKMSVDTIVIYNMSTLYFCFSFKNRDISKWPQTFELHCRYRLACWLIYVALSIHTIISLESN